MPTGNCTRAETHARAGTGARLRLARVDNDVTAQSREALRALAPVLFPRARSRHAAGAVHRTLIGSHILSVERNYRHAAPATGSARNRLWQLLISVVNIATRLLPTFGFCYVVAKATVDY